MKNRTLCSYRLVFIILALLTLAQSVAISQEGPKALPHTERQSAPREGINVHGHWNIVVRNPDGSIAERREFENSLQTYYAAPVLSALLARQSTMGFWDVVLSTTEANGVAPCNAPSVGFATFPCHVAEAGKHYPTPASTNLTVTANSTLVLTGSFTAAIKGDINYVLTEVTTCPATISPSVSCSNGGETAFTQADVSPVLVVQAGQQVLVRVEISFS